MIYDIWDIRFLLLQTNDHKLLGLKQHQSIILVSLALRIMHGLGGPYAQGSRMYLLLSSLAVGRIEFLVVVELKPLSLGICPPFLATRLS